MQQVFAQLHLMHAITKQHCNNKTVVNLSCSFYGRRLRKITKKGTEWDEVQEGEGGLTMATIFLTAFRAHVRGREKRMGF